MLGGYKGKMLVVDLSTRRISDEKLPPEDVLRQFIGGYGLGLWLLYRQCPPGTYALDPENPMIFLTGPLTASQAPSPNNLTLVTLNPSTGFLCRSHTHGFFGPNLKWAGYDGLTVTGRSQEPVYLWITEGKVEIKDATKFWGKDTHETEDLIKGDVAEPKASVAAIGPAGENLCAGALIENDKNHTLAHGSGGAVMGSKRLKAIVVYGRNKIIPADNEEMAQAAAKRWRSVLRESPLPAHKPANIPRDNYRGIKAKFRIAARNMQTTDLEGFGDGMSQQNIVPRSCYGCTIACCYDATIQYGPHKDCVATLVGGGEGLEGAAALVGIADTATVFYLTDLYDRLGLESSEAGCAISMAFEAYQKGLITKDDTDGLELKWGDAEVVEKLIRKYAARDGFGDILARGPKIAAEIIGGDAPDFAIHIKGAGMNLHDWRHGWGAMLGQIVSSASGWPAPGADLMFRPEDDTGYSERQPPLDPRGKPMEVRKTGIDKFVYDCIGVCWKTRCMSGIQMASEVISGLTGWNVTREELRAVSERVMNLERAFNVKHGLTPVDDYDVPLRLLEGQPDGPTAGHPLKPHVRGMINEYYRLMGWDEKTGKPWRSTLKRLGLDDVAKDLWD